ncbi:MAG: ectonucleotide pyrophosphatase/phosphodiesterase [Candidatus Zhuqueibacterota bacterium]
MKIQKNLLRTIFIVILFASLARTQSHEMPYVILVSFDGFRWDYVHRGLTPNLKHMEMNGVSALSLRPVFPSKTFPNHYSIITGLYPEHHGIIHNDFIDPFSGERYKIGDSKSVRDAKWYTGEAFWETAKRQGIVTASYFWPGSEVELSYRHPDYVEYFDHDRSYEARIDGVMNWLKLPEKARPHFITLYFEATDSYGHEHGPDSEETNAAIKLLDSTLGLLFKKLDEIHLAQRTNVIVVSDHGMAQINAERYINLSEILKGFDVRIQGDGPVAMIDCAEQDIAAIYQRLKSQESDYEVYLKDEMPACYHFADHPFISPIIVIANVGASLGEGLVDRLHYKHLSEGDHGYDNNHLDMHGIFFAAGPAFKKGYRTGTLWSIDIYPMLCKIFDISPRAPIDGNLERIGFILKEH